MKFTIKKASRLKIGLEALFAVVSSFVAKLVSSVAHTTLEASMLQDLSKGTNTTIERFGGIPGAVALVFVFVSVLLAIFAIVDIAGNVYLRTKENDTKEVSE